MCALSVGVVVIVPRPLFSVHIVDLGLEDPHAKEEYLGYIRVFIQVVAQSQGSSHASLVSCRLS